MSINKEIGAPKQLKNIEGKNGIEAVDLALSFIRDTYIGSKDQEEELISKFNKQIDERTFIIEELKHQIDESESQKTKLITTRDLLLDQNENLIRDYMRLTAENDELTKFKEQIMNVVVPSNEATEPSSMNSPTSHNLQFYRQRSDEYSESYKLERNARSLADTSPLSTKSMKVLSGSCCSSPENFRKEIGTDGKLFLEEVKERLSTEVFQAFVRYMKEYKSKRINRERVLERAKTILGEDNEDLYLSLELLLIPQK